MAYEQRDIPFSGGSSCSVSGSGTGLVAISWCMTVGRGGEDGTERIKIQLTMSNEGIYRMYALSAKESLREKKRNVCTEKGAMQGKDVFTHCQPVDLAIVPGAPVHHTRYRPV